MNNLTHEYFRLELDEGPVELALPRKLSAADVDDLSQWFALTLRRHYRRQAIPPVVVSEERLGQ